MNQGSFLLQIFFFPYFTNFPQIRKRSEGFIVGGENAKQGAYPFMAALGVKNPKNPLETIYVCGGSLVSQMICFSQ